MNMNFLGELGRSAMDQPWALEPGMESVASMIWALRSIDDSVLSPTVEALLASWMRGQLVAQSPGMPSAPAADAPENFAVVPIRGVLVQSANFLQRLTGASSYLKIQENLRKAMESEADTVCLMVDSPGGNVVGCEQTANYVYESRASSSSKRIISFCQGSACSAAWWIASQADEVITTPDARVGSIGVIAKITDKTRQEKNQGADTTILTTGPNKAIGAGPLTDSQQQVLREIMGEAFAAFTAGVERGRSMKLNDDMKTGRVYTGKMGKANGLVDENMTLSQVFAKYGKV